MNTSRVKAFTLIELSIVLVIIGLIVGGILTGRELIAAAKQRNVISEVAQIQTAMQTFRGKYNAFPGDMTDATTYWGAADNDPTTCMTTQGTGTQTCNGNGNGSISLQENYRMWQQLANNTGYFAGKFTGIPGPSPISGVKDQIGTNIPASRYDNNSGYVISDYWHPITFGGIKPQNVLTLAGCCHPSGNIEGSGFVPNDAYKIDLKMDDGQPDAGTMRVYAGYVNCVTSTTPGPAEYNISYNGKTCQAIFAIGQ